MRVCCFACLNLRRCGGTGSITGALCGKPGDGGDVMILASDAFLLSGGALGSTELTVDADDDDDMVDTERSDNTRVDGGSIGDDDDNGDLDERDG